MKKLSFLLLTLTLSLTASAQMEVIMEMTDNVKGLCNKNEVYMLIEAIDGQKEAICPLEKSEILKRLNTEVAFCKSNPGHNDKGTVDLVISCKGKVVKCAMGIKTKSPELDKQIETVFNSLGVWKPGTFNKKAVDSEAIWGLKVVDGVFTFE